MTLFIIQHAAVIAGLIKTIVIMAMLVIAFYLGNRGYGK